MNSSFKIGMRVVCNHCLSFIENKTGTIRDIKNSDWIGVEFDEINPQLHNLEGQCPSHKGYYVHPSTLKILNDFVENWEDIPNQVKNK